jgi:hypothetical protein
MLNRRAALSSMAALATIGLAGPRAFAAGSVDKVEEGLPWSKQLLLLMDTDKNGKVSHQEFMTYMDAEFTHLDTNKDGELDVRELTQLNHRGPSGGHR